MKLLNTLLGAEGSAASSSCFWLAKSKIFLPVAVSKPLIFKDERFLHESCSSLKMSKISSWYMGVSSMSVDVYTDLALPIGRARFSNFIRNRFWLAKSGFLFAVVDKICDTPCVSYVLLLISKGSKD